MNRERAKELLPIIQAFAEGKTIQYMQLSGKLWLDLHDEKETFDAPGDYRIKPEPKEFYIVLNSHHDYIMRAGWYDPDEVQIPGSIRVREVLE